jgi:hypothetical protein
MIRVYLKVGTHPPPSRAIDQCPINFKDTRTSVKPRRGKWGSKDSQGWTLSRGIGSMAFLRGGIKGTLNEVRGGEGG